MYVQSASNTIGGTAAADLNVISGNKGERSSLSGSGTMDNVVRDYICTNATWRHRAGQRERRSIHLRRCLRKHGRRLHHRQQPGRRQHLRQRDVAQRGGGGDDIGTDAAGDAGLGNTLVGVTIYSGATDNTIGGTTADAADVIAGNLGGVGIENTGTSDNVVEGNFIGTDVAGDTDLGNFVGIQILGECDGQYDRRDGVRSR